MHFILQHKCLKVLSVKVTKVEKNKMMVYAVKLSTYIMNNQQPSLKRKVQRLSRKRVGIIPEAAASIILFNMDEDIVQRRKLMKEYGIIYCAYNKINNKRYIGQTIQLLSERKGGHYSHDKDIYFHRALHKYNRDDWEWTVIDTAQSKDELDDKEKYWIQFYDARNPDKGYNILEGGGNLRPSQEQIRYARDNFVKLYSKNNEKDIKIMKNIRCVETGKIYKSAAEASRQTGVHHSHMVSVANGKLKTAGGYHWEWCIDISLYPNAIYCLELDKTYLNYNEAHKRDHFSNVYLSRAFKEQGSPCEYAGYTFYKLND